MLLAHVGTCWHHAPCLAYPSTCEVVLAFQKNLAKWSHRCGKTGRISRFLWFRPKRRCPKMGGTPNHPKLDHFAFETYGFGDPQFSEPPPNLGRSHKKWTAAALIPHMFRPPNVSAAHLVLPDILKARYLILFIYIQYTQYTIYIYCPCFTSCVCDAFFSAQR